jgi:hypothetical protein
MQRYGLAMRESEIERHLVWHVTRMGGVAYKFRSVTHRGVADRIVCLPDGSTHFVELKTKGGRLSPLQKVFADDMRRLNQNYVCLWRKSDVDEWAKQYA